MVDHELHQDRKLKARCLENKKCTTKEMKSKKIETGINVCERTLRKNKMGFTYRKKNQTESNTNKQEKMRLKRNNHGLWLIE